MKSMIEFRDISDLDLDPNLAQKSMGQPNFSIGIDPKKIIFYDHYDRGICKANILIQILDSRTDPAIR